MPGSTNLSPSCSDLNSFVKQASGPRPLLATARNRYVNTSPTTVPASHLKDQDHEIRRSIELADVVIHENQLEGLMEEVAWETAVKQGIDLREEAVRPDELVDALVSIMKTGSAVINTHIP